MKRGLALMGAIIGGEHPVTNTRTNEQTNERTTD